MIELRYIILPFLGPFVLKKIERLAYLFLRTFCGYNQKQQILSLLLVLSWSTNFIYHIHRNLAGVMVDPE